MSQTTLDFLRADKGWEPTMRLRFERTSSACLLHQLWVHVSGKQEWRLVETVDTRQGEQGQ
jgi:hypothetical protein